MSSSTLKVEHHGSIARILLNRPEAHNAFNADLIQALTKTFSSLSKESDLRVILLSGEGKNFCAGGDLNWMKDASKLSKTENEKDAKALHQMFESMTESKVPIVTSVQGLALGGGVGLIAASDIVICTEDAQFGLSEVKLGLIPSVIAPFVIQKIGISHYNAYAISSKRFGSIDAVHMGLVHEASPNLDASVQSWVKAILEGAPNAQKEIKGFSKKIASLPISKAGVLTSKMIAKVRVDPEAQEGLAAFLEKRKPKWSP
jgi:methylglutaconyl-CoA hydratase